MQRSWVASGENAPDTDDSCYIVAKQLRTADVGQFSILGIGWRANKSSMLSRNISRRPRNGFF
jgi:hypothetical protein